MKNNGKATSIAIINLDKFVTLYSCLQVLQDIL